MSLLLLLNSAPAPVPSYPGVQQHLLLALQWIVEAPDPPDDAPPEAPPAPRGSGGLAYAKSYATESEADRRHWQILRDDEELLVILEAFVECEAWEPLLSV